MNGENVYRGKETLAALGGRKTSSVKTSSVASGTSTTSSLLVRQQSLTKTTAASTGISAHKRTGLSEIEPSAKRTRAEPARVRAEPVKKQCVVPSASVRAAIKTVKEKEKASAARASRNAAVSRYARAALPSKSARSERPMVPAPATRAVEPSHSRLSEVSYAVTSRMMNPSPAPSTETASSSRVSARIPGSYIPVPSRTIAHGLPTPRSSNEYEPQPNRQTEILHKTLQHTNTDDAMDIDDDAENLPPVPPTTTAISRKQHQTDIQRKLSQTAIVAVPQKVPRPIARTVSDPVVTVTTSKPPVRRNLSDIPSTERPVGSRVSSERSMRVTNILFEAEYEDEIYQHVREMELRLMPNPKYMDNQTELNWMMRLQLVDWIVQVHDRFKLLPETLYLTVNIVDRFLSCKNVAVQKLQLVGIAALFIATKFEESRVPTVANLEYMVNGAYTKQDMLNAERVILRTLKFELGAPGPYQFMRRISAADNFDSRPRTMSKYFMEATLLDERFLECPSSLVAAAAMFLSRKIIYTADWTPALEKASGYSVAEVTKWAYTMVQCVATRAEGTYLFGKYSSREPFLEAAPFVAQYIKKWGY
ncbi:hypothetical protein HK104_001194 [Borealophlyctis nickersoniae]|nr:hypothetical protein HK104_001194 [Borealophlyctis nickersoniae]